MGRAADRADHVVSAARDAGATDADLRTSGVNLWYDQSAGHYVATYSMTIGVDLEHLGRYLDAAAIAGGDEFVLNGVSFSVSNRDVVVAPLRELALADARAKATALAAAEGDTVGRVVAIVEGGGVGAIPMPRGAMRAMAAMPIEPGTETVTLDVTASYELLATD